MRSHAPATRAPASAWQKKSSSRLERLLIFSTHYSDGRERTLYSIDRECHCDSCVRLDLVRNSQLHPVHAHLAGSQNSFEHFCRPLADAGFDLADNSSGRTLRSRLTRRHHRIGSPQPRCHYHQLLARSRRPSGIGLHQSIVRLRWYRAPRASCLGTSSTSTGSDFLSTLLAVVRPVASFCGSM